jgi:hypothetical protein
MTRLRPWVDSHRHKFKFLLPVTLLPVPHSIMAPHSAISFEIEGVTDTEAIVLPDPLTVNGVPARRAKSGKLVAGTAAYTSSDFFKSSVSTLIPKKEPS